MLKDVDHGGLRPDGRGFGGEDVGRAAEGERLERDRWEVLFASKSAWIPQYALH